MATPSQIESNRANAARSTGPRTEAGKAASSRNAIKHGLAGGVLFIEGEDPAAFHLLLADLIAEHTPATTAERMIVENLARQFWFSCRAARLEAAALDADDLPRFALMMRYRITAERAFSKALEDLRKAKQSRPIGFVSKSPNPCPSVSIRGPIPQHRHQKIGRNEPCPCGSGKKYKRCCLGKPESLSKAA
jgi:hypothetical protein